MAGEQKTEPAVEPVGLPASPLAGADSGKHEFAPQPEVKAEVKAEPAPETKPESKPEPKAEAKAPEPEKSPAESAEKPPETKPEAKEPPKPEEKAEPEKKPEAEVKEKVAAKPETKPDETKPEAPKEPEVRPTYDKLTLPENVKLDDARVAKFDEIVGKAELAAKTDPHAALATFRQDAVNFHLDEIQRVAKAVSDNQINVWNKLVETRVNELKNDPELGGNRIDTSLGNAKYALESLIPGFTKDEATELIGIMDKGGVSHHRLTIKMLNAIYNLMAEPEPVNNGQPLNQQQTKQAGERGWYKTVDAKTA
jgi:hypothetical protein